MFTIKFGELPGSRMYTMKQRSGAALCVSSGPERTAFVHIWLSFSGAKWGPRCTIKLFLLWSSISSHISKIKERFKYTCKSVSVYKWKTTYHITAKIQSLYLKRWAKAGVFTSIVNKWCHQSFSTFFPTERITLMRVNKSISSYGGGRTK